MRRLAIVPTGTANTASVIAALTRLGASVRETTSADEVRSADGVVLPGVGAFGTAMSKIDALGLSAALRERVAAGRATLAVCVGMQLLGRDSEESPSALGLGVFDESVSRFGDGVIVPQMGWNTVEADAGSSLVQSGWAYFANSFRIQHAPTGWVASRSDHGGGFVAAIEKGDVLACQFHPELSGEWGASLLGRWLQRVKEAA